MAPDAAHKVSGNAGEQSAQCGAPAASDRVAYNGLSMRAGHSIVRAVAHGMRTIFYSKPSRPSAPPG